MKLAPQRTYSIAAVDRAASVLAALAANPGASLVEVSRATGLSSATALRYLKSLAGHQLAERDEEGRYRLGLGVFQLGQRALHGRDPRGVALPFMEGLLERFGETVNFAVRHGDALVLIEVLESPHSIKKGAAVGEQDVWHASSLGKAILAFLPADEALALLERRGTPRYTPKTVVVPAALRRELARVRELGYAVDDEEGEEGLRCVGAPVFDRRARPAYAISLSGPASRISAGTVRAMGADLREAAMAISAELGFTGDGR